MDREGDRENYIQFRAAGPMFRLKTTVPIHLSVYRCIFPHRYSTGSPARTRQWDKKMPVVTVPFEIVPSSRHAADLRKDGVKRDQRYPMR